MAKLSIDVKAQLSLYRRATFASPYVFFSEAIQNAQRAKASEVRIWIEHDQVTIHDDGPGLSSPEALFTIAKSGWDEQTKRESNPFGIGFFSCLALGSKIDIASNGRHYSLDYDKLIESDDLVIDEWAEDPTPGFEVTVSNLFGNYSRWDAGRVARDTARTVLGIDIYVDGALVEKEDPANTPTDRPYVLVRMPGVSGWIACGNLYWEDEMKVYHEGRFVCKLPMYGMVGAIEVKATAVTLRAPDRREIIRDDQYDKLMSVLRGKARQSVLKSLSAGMKLPDGTVTSYLKPEEWAKSLKYTVLTKELDLDKFDKVERYKLKDLSQDELESFLDVTEPEPEVEEAEFIRESATTYTPRSEASTVPSRPAVVAPSLEKLTEEASATMPEVKRPGDISWKSISYASKRGDLYYAEPTDLKDHKEELKALLSAGATILVVRNSLEKDGLCGSFRIRYAGDAVTKKTSTYKFEGKRSKATDRVCRLVRQLVFLCDVRNVDHDCHFEVHGGKVTRKTEIRVNEHIVSATTDHPAFAIDYETGILYVSNQADRARIVPMDDPRTDLGELLYVLEHIEELSEALNTGVAKIAVALARVQTSWIVTNMAIPQDIKEGVE